MDFRIYIPLIAAMLGVASGRVVRWFEIQVAKATNGQKNGFAEESKPAEIWMLYFFQPRTMRHGYVSQHPSKEFLLCNIAVEQNSWGGGGTLPRNILGAGSRLNQQSKLSSLKFES